MFFFFTFWFIYIFLSVLQLHHEDIKSKHRTNRKHLCETQAVIATQIPLNDCDGYDNQNIIVLILVSFHCFFFMILPHRAVENDNT